MTESIVLLKKDQRMSDISYSFAKWEKPSGMPVDREILVTSRLL